MNDVADLGGARKAARAIDALRRGWPFRVEGNDGALDLLAVESARDAALADFASHDVLLSGERAVTLKLTNQRAAATPGPVRLAGAADTVAAALAIADPALDLANPLKGPFHTMATGGETAAVAAMTMARHAGLLPAFFVREATGSAETSCSVDDVAALLDPERL
ncbi:MAG TPA: GTP cyclohydrolase II, partial [Sphingopyxis sp.]|nr:GTP cyclohydrolase II [Sphingopyxis sp.]